MVEKEIPRKLNGPEGEESRGPKITEGEVLPGDFAVVRALLPGKGLFVVPVRRPAGKQKLPHFPVPKTPWGAPEKRGPSFPSPSAWLKGFESSAKVAQQMLLLRGKPSHAVEGTELNIGVSRKKREQAEQSLEEVREFLAGDKPGVLITSFATHEVLLRMAAPTTDKGERPIWKEAVREGESVRVADVENWVAGWIELFIDEAVRGGRWRELPKAVSKGRGASPRSSGWRAEEKAAGVLKTEVMKLPREAFGEGFPHDVFLVRDDFDYDPNRIKGSKFYVVKI